MIYRNSPRGTSPGTISVKSCVPTILKSRGRKGAGIPVQLQQNTWRVPRDAPGPFPHDRSICLNVYSAADDLRRFVPRPEDGLPGFVARAFQYGHSLLARDYNFDWSRWCDYLVAKHAFDRLEHVQERITRTFKSTESLRVRRALHNFLGYADVLPDDLGLASNGAGRRWLVENVLSEGRRAASDDGLTKPTDSDAITYGLLAAGHLNPLRIGEDEALSLMRMALYDFSRCDSAVSDGDRDEVWRRFHGLIRDHLDEERHQFKKWLMGGNSNVIKSIANQASGSGQKLTRPLVKRALHDLGWRGYQLVGECIEAFARAFSRALPQPLSPREQEYYQAMYYRQPYLGGLPLVLVMERRTLIQPAILQLWENPGDERTIGALHQVLRYYTEMVPRRREADRVAKQKPVQLKISHVPEEVIELIGEAETSRSSLDEVWQYLIERRGITCSRCKAIPYGEPYTEDFRVGQPLRLKMLCRDHGEIETIEISWREIESMRALFID